MKKTTYTTTRFEVNEAFYVEVSPNEDMIEFVLCMRDYCLKCLMFSYCAEDCPEDIWERLINEEVKEHITSFLNEIYDVFESGFLEEHGFYDRIVMD